MSFEKIILQQFSSLKIPTTITMTRMLSKTSSLHVLHSVPSEIPSTLMPEPESTHCLCSVIGGSREALFFI